MFINEMQKTLNDEFNHSGTENGADGYKTTGKKLLDLTFSVTSLRNAEESEIISAFMKAYYDDKAMAMKWLFYARDAREGLGERRLFRVVLEYLMNTHTTVVQSLIQYVAEYGRFDDLWCLLGTRGESTVIELVRKQLAEDNEKMTAGEPISLLAKWMPSANTSSKATVAKARILIKALGMNEASYRKMLTKMRKYLDVVEIKMSNHNWDSINYEAVPSRANLLYKDAFMRNDTDRRREFLTALEEGKITINAGVLYPHDIVHRYMDAYNGVKTRDTALEELWKALPDAVNGASNTIVVADGSGSMTTTVGRTEVTALSVANAMAIYFAERSSGQFKNKYITFSEHPKLVDFSNCTSLRDKIAKALLNDEVANTNIKAVFDLILTTAVRSNMQQSDLPQNILIVSDMEFDAATCHNPDRRLFNTIADNYKAHGYMLPRLIFWNVCSRTMTIPVIENDLGIALVSGFSVNITKMVLSGELDPYKCLMEQLMGERYAKIIV